MTRRLPGGREVVEITSSRSLRLNSLSQPIPMTLVPAITACARLPSGCALVLSTSLANSMTSWSGTRAHRAWPPGKRAQAVIATPPCLTITLE